MLIVFPRPGHRAEWCESRGEMEDSQRVNQQCQIMGILLKIYELGVGEIAGALTENLSTGTSTHIRRLTSTCNSWDSLL
jgi:hypothetical protein